MTDFTTEAPRVGPNWSQTPACRSTLPYEAPKRPSPPCCGSDRALARMALASLSTTGGGQEERT